MVTLKIQTDRGWSDLDLTDNPGISITKRFSDLQEPTDYFADYSKTVRIPRTTNNNKILQDLYRLDVVSFDSRKKVHFMILVDGAKMVSGVAKMLSVDKDFYDIQLSGEMADAFKTLRSLTFTKGSKYTIDDPLSEGLTINRFLVDRSWKNTNPQLNLDNCDDVDIIGFCPTIHGLNPGFDSKSMTVTNSSGVLTNKTIGDYIDLIKQSTSGSDIVGDGFSERQMGEFRSYYQKPFIYVNKLFQIFRRESINRCNYHLELDHDWFNDSNRFYSKVVYMLPDLLSENASDNTTNTNLPPLEYVRNFPSTGKTDGIDQWYSVSNPEPVTVEKGYETSLKMNVRFDIQADNTGAITFNKTRIDPDNGIIIEVYAANANSGLILTSKSILICNDDTRLDTNAYDQVVRFGYVLNYNFSVNNPANFKGDIPITLGIRTNNPVKLGIRTRFHNTSMPWQGKDTITAGIHYNYWQAGANPINVILENLTLTKTANRRSDSPVTMDRLWPVDKTIYDVIINYCKMFGLVIKVDDDDEVIRIMSRSKFFSGYQIKDWSDRIDKDSIVINPAALQERYLQFGYKESPDSIMKAYNDKFRVPYGSFTLDTENEFNNDTKTIFDGISPSCIASESMSTLFNVLHEWLGTGHPLTVHASSEVYPCNNGDSWGGFYFVSGTQPVDVKLGGSLSSRNSVIITDDDDYQVRNSAFCYTGASGISIAETSIPVVSTLDEMKEYSLQFGPSREYYCAKSYINENAQDVFHTFHARWYREHYNVSNKLITANFKLSYLDMLHFDFKDFIKISDNIYAVQRISDFDPTNDAGLTSVELLQVDNIEDYTTSYSEPYLELSRINVDYLANLENIGVFSSTPFEAVSEAPWINIQKVSSQGFIFSCTPWNAPVQRLGRIKVSNGLLTKYVSVRQRYNGECHVYIKPNVWNVGNEGSARLFDVDSTNGWTITNDGGLKCWITLDRFRGTSVPSRLGVEVPANNTPFIKTYNVVLTSKCNVNVKATLAISQVGTSVGPITGDVIKQEVVDSVKVSAVAPEAVSFDVVSPVKPVSVLPIRRVLEQDGKPVEVSVSNISVGTTDKKNVFKVTLDEKQVSEIVRLGGGVVSVLMEDGSIKSVAVNV